MSTRRHRQSKHASGWAAPLRTQNTVKEMALWTVICGALSLRRGWTGTRRLNAAALSQQRRVRRSTATKLCTKIAAINHTADRIQPPISATMRPVTTSAMSRDTAEETTRFNARWTAFRSDSGALIFEWGRSVSFQPKRTIEAEVHPARPQRHHGGDRPHAGRGARRTTAESAASFKASAVLSAQSLDPKKLRSGHAMKPSRVLCGPYRSDSAELAETMVQIWFRYGPRRTCRNDGHSSLCSTNSL